MQREIIEKIKEDDAIVIHAIDRYLRRMIRESVRQMEHDALFSKENCELQKELQILKKVNKELKKQANAILTFDFMNQYFASYPYIGQAFMGYENKMEKQFEEIRKLNFISALSEVVHGEKAPAKIASKARLVLKNDGNCLFDSPYGLLYIGDFYDQLSTEELKRLKENIQISGPKNCHTISGICAKHLKADICTGYVNSQIPNLRVLHSWLEKDNECYDVNTGIYMKKEDYQYFYQPEYVNRLHYGDLNGLELVVEDGVSYVCYLAYQKIEQEEEKKLLYQHV